MTYKGWYAIKNNQPTNNPGLLWPGALVTIRVASMVQLDLFSNHLYEIEISDTL